MEDVEREVVNILFSDQFFGDIATLLYLNVYISADHSLRQ